MVGRGQSRTRGIYIRFTWQGSDSSFIVNSRHTISDLLACVNFLAKELRGGVLLSSPYWIAISLGPPDSCPWARPCYADSHGRTQPRRGARSPREGLFPGRSGAGLWPLFGFLAASPSLAWVPGYAWLRRKTQSKALKKAQLLSCVHAQNDTLLACSGL